MYQIAHAAHAVAAIPQVRELNIGHFLIGAAITEGLGASVRRMRDLIHQARYTSAA